MACAGGSPNANGCRCDYCRAFRADGEAALTLGDLDWQERARCRELQLPVELFFTERGEAVDFRVDAACSQCPVARECRSYAIEHNLPGVWGGTTGRDRRTFRNGKTM